MYMILLMPKLTTTLCLVLSHCLLGHLYSCLIAYVLYIIAHSDLCYRLKGEFLLNDYVDYAALKSSSFYAEFLSLACKLRAVDLGAYSEQQRKAFFISILNIDSSNQSFHNLCSTFFHYIFFIRTHPVTHYLTIFLNIVLIHIQHTYHTWRHISRANARICAQGQAILEDDCL